jgi:hypothetical protein
VLSSSFSLKFSWLRKPDDYGKVIKYLQVVDKNCLNQISIFSEKIFDISLKKIYLKNIG